MSAVVLASILEHSRNFHFAHGHEDPNEGEFFIGSADWMYRNLSKRIEVIAPALVTAPILAPTSKAKLWEILDNCLHDQRQAWTLGFRRKY